MGVDLKKPQHIILFAVIFPAITIWLNQFVAFIPNLPLWIDKPTLLVIYGALFFLFNRYFWSWPIFYWVRVIEVPDLSGRWIGKQISSYKKHGKNVEVPGAIEIRQTFSDLSFKAYYEKMASKRAVACFGYNGEDRYLYYTYEAEVNVHKEGTMQNQLGTARLEYVKKGKTRQLSGKYFNDMGNHGDMYYQFESSRLKYAL